MNNRANNYNCNGCSRNSSYNETSRNFSCNDCTGAPSCNDRNQRTVSSCYSKEAKILIKKLQAVDFSMVDTILYLDVYPHCQKAISYYKELKCQREKLIAKLAEMGVPMNNMSVGADNWNWTDSPWPWELDANI